MAYDLNYGNLVQAVKDYNQRYETVFSKNIPLFINLAEKQIASDFKVLWNLAVAQGTITAGTLFFDKPARWRKTVSISVAGVTLPERQYEYLRSVSTDLPAGVPQFWADYDYNNYAVSPIADMAYSVEIIYFEQPVPLSEQVSDNLITREAPQLLLYCTLMQAAQFLKQPDKYQMWSAAYKDAGMSLKQEDQARPIDRNTAAIGAGGQ